uniref:Uncharacterized protein n=1 Tax=Solanum lycopersicum TaxID=4081 RepID=A0A3Q7FG54_SOLLC
MSGTLRVSSLKLWELGLLAQGVAPQDAGARLACSIDHASSFEGAGVAHSSSNVPSFVRKYGVLRAS